MPPLLVRVQLCSVTISLRGKGPNKLISPTLGWERNYSWEVGFDMHMFNDRLQLSPVYYNKTTKDMLTSIPGIAGTVPGLQNVGEIRNRGFELSASWNDKIGEDWRYGLGANLSTIDNKVLSLVNKDYNIISGPSRVSEVIRLAISMVTRLRVYIRTKTTSVSLRLTRLAR